MSTSTQASTASPTATKKLAFGTQDDLCNTTVIDADSGNTLYLVSTKSSSEGVTATTICTSDSQIVAEWERNASEPKHDYVTVQGRTRSKLSDWLPKASMFSLSSKRVFTAPDGRTYHWSWKEDSHGFEARILILPGVSPVVARLCSPPQLVDAHTRTVVAHSERDPVWPYLKVFLHVQPSHTHMLEPILLAFIILEQQRRERARGARRTSTYAVNAAAMWLNGSLTNAVITSLASPPPLSKR
ncbi:hypothetical protein C8Q80DRAFT_1267233 [Daedaleopsis nitida]|nr:hypothetical protein C8Q80DRAFT_1267233 [Daedaleopsis nitida]